MDFGVGQTHILGSVAAVILGDLSLTSLPSSVKWELCHQLSWDDNVESFGGKITRGS